MKVLGRPGREKNAATKKEIVALRRRAGASKKTSEKTKYFRKDFRKNRVFQDGLPKFPKGFRTLTV